MNITPDLGEFAGIFIGDGFGNRYGNHYIIEFTGNISEIEYFENTIIPLIQRTFDGKPHLRKIGNAIRLRYNSKRMFQEIVGIGLPSGRKSSTVRIPEGFLQNNIILKRVVRGIMDSDGSVIWDKRKIYKKPYPRISLTTVSKHLALQVRIILERLGFSVYFKEYTKSGTKSKIYHIDLYGTRQLEKWKKEIGFSNPKNIIRMYMPQ